MTNLIEELKKEHRIMLDALSEVKKLGISSSTARERLLSTKNLLIAHITKEDEQYYSALRKAAENDKALKVMLDYFSEDMKAVSEKAMHFFEKYSQGGDETEFEGDIILFCMMLMDRISAEEKNLFRRFDPPSSKNPVPAR